MHLGEVGMSKAHDDEILAFSLAKNAIIVTLDADFHTMLAVSGASGPSVIRLRMQGLGATEVVELVRVFSQVSEPILSADLSSP
jgi:predicted nuclease of predicted toxin-antitoxin system